MRTTASNLRHEPPCTRVHYPGFLLPLLPRNSSINYSAICSLFIPVSLTFPVAANFSQSRPRFPPSRTLWVVTPPPPGIFLPVGPASRHFGRTNYCFPSYFAPAMHRRDSRDAVAVAWQLRGCNLRPTSNNARAVAGECCPGFLSALSPPPPRSPVPPPSLRPPLLFCASVSHVCAFRVHGYLECTPCPEALRDNGVCRVIFVYAGSWTIPSYVMLFEAFVPFFFYSLLSFNLSIL